MAQFLALYTGDRPDNAQVVAVSTNPDTVQRFAAELLNQPTYKTDSPDPVLAALTDGRRRALRIVAGGAA